MQNILIEDRYDPLLPHGRFVRMAESDLSGEPAFEMQSRGAFSLIPGSFKNQAVIVVDQPACGRHWGQEIELLAEVLSAKPIAFSDRVLNQALLLGQLNNEILTSDSLLSKVQLLPLADETYEEMFSATTPT